MIRDQNSAPAELLEKQTLLKKDVVERLRGGDVAQIDIDVSRLHKRLPVENNIQVELLGEAANESFQISAVTNDAQLLSSGWRQSSFLSARLSQRSRL